MKRRCLLLPMLALLLCSCPAVADQPLPAWRIAADQRIEQIRKGDFSITLVDEAGQPIGGADVQLVQTRSHFGFGTTVHGNPLSEAPAEQRYRQFILDHFSMVVCENVMKWWDIERQRGQQNFGPADRWVEFAHQHDLPMRGHTLLWAKPHWNQPWLHELEPDELRAETERHVRTMVERYRGKLVAWDSINEMLTGFFYRDRLGHEFQVNVHKIAAEADPDTPLFVNEYSILGNPGKTQRYIDLIRRIQADGAPIGGIGIQDHGVQRFFVPGPGEQTPAGRVGPEQILQTFDRFAEFDLPIHLTEISSNTEDLQQRARTLEMLYRVAFSHPSVDVILLWGFWEGRHFQGARGALIDRQWNILPAGEAIFPLLTEEWRTRHSGRTDAEGNLTFRGFYGTYQVLFERDGVPLVATVQLTPDEKTARTTLAPRQ